MRTAIFGYDGRWVVSDESSYVNEHFIHEQEVIDFIDNNRHLSYVVAVLHHEPPPQPYNIIIHLYNLYKERKILTPEIISFPAVIFASEVYREDRSWKESIKKYIIHPNISRSVGGCRPICYEDYFFAKVNKYTQLLEDHSKQQLINAALKHILWVPCSFFSIQDPYALAALIGGIGDPRWYRLPTAVSLGDFHLIANKFRYPKTKIIPLLESLKFGHPKVYRGDLDEYSIFAWFDFKYVHEALNNVLKFLDETATWTRADEQPIPGLRAGDVFVRYLIRLLIYYDVNYDDNENYRKLGKAVVETTRHFLDTLLNLWLWAIERNRVPDYACPYLPILNKDEIDALVEFVGNAENIVD